jgi:hypothetical protein
MKMRFQTGFQTDFKRNMKDYDKSLKMLVQLGRVELPTS